MVGRGRDQYAKETTSTDFHGLLSFFEKKEENRITPVHKYNFHFRIYVRKTIRAITTMASRNSGSRVVVMAVTATLTALGVGTIYLPFIADKDKVRGLHEEAYDGGMDERSRREYQAMLRQMGGGTMDQHQHPSGGGAGTEHAAAAAAPARPSNSMWSRLKRDS